MKTDSLARPMLQALFSDPDWPLGLLGRRWFWCLVHSCTYYFLAHNLWAFGSSLLLLFLTTAAWLRQNLAWRKLALPSLALALQFCLVGFSWSGHDGRDLTRLTPALLLMAGAALGMSLRDPDCLY